MCEMKIALTNLGKYNEGELVYTWLELPATEDEIKAAFDEIGVGPEPDEYGNYYEEFFITDYECDFYEVGEYENLEELNRIAEALENLDEWERDIVKTLMNDGYNLDDAIAAAPDCYYYEGDTMGDVAYNMYIEGLWGDKIPESLENYIDWDALGRDLEYDGHWIRTETGYIEVIR